MVLRWCKLFLDLLEGLIGASNMPSLVSVGYLPDLFQNYEYLISVCIQSGIMSIISIINRSRIPQAFLSYHSIPLTPKIFPSRVKSR